MVYRSIRTGGRHMPGGFHVVLWLQGHKASSAIADATGMLLLTRWLGIMSGMRLLR